MDIRVLPIGLVSKNRIGALSTRANILLCTILAEFNIKKKKNADLSPANNASDPMSPPYIPIR